MNAIPLSAPDGTVYTYACGVCHNVHDGTTIYGQTRRLPTLAEGAREKAERCCRCERCGRKLRRDWMRSVCKRCRPHVEAEQAKRNAEYQAKRDAAEVALEASLAASTNRAAALCLRGNMSDISEEYYCAGWLVGLEFELWAMVQGGPRNFGMGEVTEREVAELRRLSDACGGWWVYDDTHGELFVAREEWERRYAKVSKSEAPR